MVSKHLARAAEDQYDSDGDSLYEVLQDHRIYINNSDNVQWYAVETDKMTRIDGNSKSGL